MEELSAAELEERRKAEERLELARAEEKRGRELAAAPDAKERAEECRLNAGTPVGFARAVLGLTLYLWQAVVLTWFEDTLELVKASLCTPNGAGKSERIVGTIALWWISVHPQGRVVITTKDAKQLDQQIWPSIDRHKGKFPGYGFIERLVRNGTGGFIIGFTTDDPGRAEGWHKIDDENGPLLVIGDEAKSIADAIHMALDRCTYNAKLLTSSPGLTEGLFWKSQTTLAGKKFDASGFIGEGGCPDGGFLAMKVGLVDCPHIPASRIKNIIQTYGEDHWFTRSTLHAEFTDTDSETLFVFPKHLVREVMENPPRYVPGGQCASCDFAAGRNENVFTHRRGNRIEQVSWKDPDPMRAISRFIQLFVERGLHPSEIDGDAGGMGIPILARFNELGWPINPINNESPARDSDKYPNLAAEDWHDGAVKLSRRDLIIPNDPVLFEQLTTRRAAPTSKALLGLETKREMKKRGVESPDRGDGFVRVLAHDLEGGNAMFDQEGLAKLEVQARACRVEVGSLDEAREQVRYERRVDGWLNIYERPVIGFGYLVVVNPHRYDEPLKNHVLMVVRAPYWDDKEGVERPARLAAKVRVQPFRLDARPLTKMAAKVANWYGKAMVVPVTNDRGDVIEGLIQEGLHVYAREDLETMGHGRKQTFEFGWESDQFTRSLWIGALSDAVREDRVVVEDVPTVMQMFQMQGKDSGMRDAEALGVAMYLIGSATTYLAPRRDAERSVKVSQYS